MENYKETEEIIGNYDDEPPVNYHSKPDKTITLIRDRLAQLNNEIEMGEITPKVKEYNQVRINELEMLLKQDGKTK